MIQNAIRSIIDQTYKHWELIIVDDGSVDGTYRIVSNFAHPKIIYHKIEHQDNISRVRNIGNSLATGDIIVVQDSDDMSLPDRLGEIVKTYKEYPKADVVYHGMYLRLKDPYTDSITRSVRPAIAFDRDRLKKEQYIAAQLSYKRSVALEIPYNEDVPLMDDFAFLLELAYSNKHFQPIYKNLYEYWYTQDSINIQGESDGRRKRDTETILQMLRDKYHVKDIHANLFKEVEGVTVSEETL